MSGICGIINLDGAPVEPGVLEKMAREAEHRGPDGIRYWGSGGAGLAHLALNDTPESVRENQPLVSKGGNLILTADARVDNRGELIHALKGYLKSGDPTDADLILASYQRWGEDCPGHLIGDFAFAIWDRRRRILFGARDPMGMRALYYRVEPRRVLFGTEVKQILAAPEVPARIFEPAVGAHLAGCFGPLEWSFYEGISQLAPAHAMVAGTSGCRTWRYWDIDPDYTIEYSREEDYVEHFFEVFSEAVGCRLRSTKPVGIFLSGGVDSGNIASTAGWLLRRNREADDPTFHAYCWAFDELTQCDERHISERIAGHYGIPVTEVPADDAWPLKGYPAHGPDRDEPFIGAYQALLEHALAMARSEEMGLMISGDRGDLMVGDVAFDHPGLLRSGQLRTLWGELRAHGRRHNASLGRMAMGHLLKPLLLNTWPRRTEWALEMRRKLRGSEPHPSPYPDWVRPEFARKIGLDEIIEESELQPPINEPARRMRYELIFAPMHMRGVVWSERTQANFGMGFADPWSDRRLAEFVLAVPQWRIQQLREPKRIARQAMRGVMPEEARKRVGKISPEPLYERAIREREKKTIMALITDSQAAARGYLDERELRAHYQSVLHGAPIHPYLWWALTLEMWLRQYWR